MSDRDLGAQVDGLEQRLARLEGNASAQFPNEICDQDGKPMLTLAAGGDGPVLTLWNREGEPAVELIAGKQGRVNLYAACERVLTIEGFEVGARIALRTPGRSATMELATKDDIASLYLGGDHLDGHVAIQTVGDGAEINVWREPDRETVSLKAGAFGVGVTFCKP